MKIVNASRKQTKEEMFKVGNVIYNGFDYYLVVSSDKGYTLINLSDNSVFMEQSSLSELESSSHWSEDGELVDAELTIIE